MSRVYESWIIHDDSGETHGCYDWRNGGAYGAAYACAWLNENFLEIYSMVVISGKKLCG